MQSKLLENMLIQTVNIARQFKQPPFKTEHPVEIIERIKIIKPHYSFEEESVHSNGYCDTLSLSYEIEDDIYEDTPMHKFTMTFIKGEKRSYHQIDIEHEIAEIESSKTGTEDAVTNSLIDLFSDMFIRKDKNGKRYVVSENGEEVRFKYILKAGKEFLVMETKEEDHLMVSRDILKRIKNYEFINPF